MTKTASKARKQRWAYKWKAHIEHYFSEEEVADCLEWIDDRDRGIVECIEIITQKEIGIKFVYSLGSDSYRIILQPKAQEHPYVGYTIGFAHTSLSRLAPIGLYIVDVIMENGGIQIPSVRDVAEW